MVWWVENLTIKSNSAQLSYASIETGQNLAIGLLGHHSLLVLGLEGRGDLVKYQNFIGLFFGSRSGSKTFLELTNVDYQFLFWKYSHIFLFKFRPNLGPFYTFRALRGYFWGWGQVQKLFWYQLT